MLEEDMSDFKGSQYQDESSNGSA